MNVITSGLLKAAKIEDRVQLNPDPRLVERIDQLERRLDGLEAELSTHRITVGNTNNQ